jgi:uncharacterized protein YfaS (alpha-2-macroglobulin family)
LSAEEDYRLMFDPYWVRADPYRVSLPPGSSAEVTLHVRNFHDRPQRYRVAMQTSPGIQVEPTVLEGTTPAQSTSQATFRVIAGAEAAAGVRIITFDTTLDQRRYGPWFDMIVGVP